MTVNTQSVYDDTVDLLKKLDEDQLMAIHSVIIEMTVAQGGVSNSLGIRNEDELWQHIDHSFEQAKLGKGRTAEEVIGDLKREYVR